jgi:hypothetical protein
MKQSRMSWAAVVHHLLGKPDAPLPTAEAWQAHAAAGYYLVPGVPDQKPQTVAAVVPSSHTRELRVTAGQIHMTHADHARVRQEVDHSRCLVADLDVGDQGPEARWTSAELGL